MPSSLDTLLSSSKSFLLPIKPASKHRYTEACLPFSLFPPATQANSWCPWSFQGRLNRRPVELFQHLDNKGAWWIWSARPLQCPKYLAGFPIPFLFLPSSPGKLQPEWARDSFWRLLPCTASLWRSSRQPHSRREQVWQLSWQLRASESLEIFQSTWWSFPSSLKSTLLIFDEVYNTGSFFNKIMKRCRSALKSRNLLRLSLLRYWFIENYWRNRPLLLLYIAICVV